MGSIGFRLAALLVACGSSVATAQTELFHEDFESGLGRWSATSMWHLESEADTCGSVLAPFPSPGTAARYGQTTFNCNFNGDHSGDLTLLAPVSIPTWAGDVRLTYWTWEETECEQLNGEPGNCGWDHRTVSVSADGGQTWTDVAFGGEEQVWRLVTVDLSAYRGEDVLLRLTFDTVDSLWNDFQGWYVDDVRIEYDPPTPSSYCTAKINSAGCTPTLSWSGTPSLSASDPFTVTATEILNKKASKLIWSRTPDAKPFTGGTLCVKPPAARTTIHSSGGSPSGPDCSGSYSWAFTPAYLASKNVMPGQTLYVQFSGRDPGFPPPQNHSLSDGLAVTFVP